jgi:hypothetical protein
MLITYETQTRKITSISSARPVNGKLSKSELRPVMVGGIPAGQGVLYMDDIGTITRVLECLKSGVKVELDKDLSVITYSIIAFYMTPEAPFKDGETVVTGMIPKDSADSKISFQINSGDIIEEGVVDGMAKHTFIFSDPGEYTITLSSESHGTISKVVTVA